MKNIRNLYNINYYNQKGVAGSHSTIAVLDTGLYPHPDLTDNLIQFRDFVNNRVSLYDDNSHGTHVSGIVCGKGKLNRLYKGIAPDARLISLKVLDSTGHGNSENIIRAIEWIISNRSKYNINIVNISIGTKALSCQDEGSHLVRSVDALWDEGVTVLVSAGNNGPGYQSITTPGISRKVITVGSCKSSHTKHVGDSAFSGKGPTFCNIPKPDIVAPGDDIISCAVGGKGYTTKSGTSMSTPIVSGAAALILSHFPKITNNDFKRLLCQSADDIGLDRYTQGCGRLNFSKLFSLSEAFL